MSGYLYFAYTNEPAIDAVLSAVENAGTAYHSTEWWSDRDGPDEPSHVDRINAAAAAGGQAITAIRATIAQAVADLDGSHYVNEHGDLCAMCGAADGAWPCTARLVADDLRKSIEAGT